MNRYEKLLKNSAIFFVANFGSKVLSFLLVRFYTEMLSTEEFGVLDLILTTVSLAVPIVTLCITEAVLRFSIDDVENRNKIFSLGIEVVILGNLLFLLSIPVFVNIEILRANLCLIYILTITNAVFIVAAHFSRGIGLSKVFALSGFLHTIFQIGLNILFLLGFNMGVTGYLWATILANLFSTVAVVMMGHLYLYLEITIERSLLKDMLRYSIPLIPNTLFWWIMQSADRYIIAFFLNNAANGIYAAANKIPTIIITLNNIFSQAWQLSSVDEAKSEDKSEFYSEIFKVLSVIVTFSASLIIVFLPYIYRLLVNEAYYSGWTCVPFLLIAMVFSCYSSFLGTNYVAMKKTTGAFTTTVIGAAVNIGLNFVLTPYMGLNGTAIATAVSFLVTWLVRAYDTRKFVKLHYGVRTVVLPSIILSVQGLMVFFNRYSIIVQTIFALVIAIMNYDLIISIIKRLLVIIRKKVCSESSKNV